MQIMLELLGISRSSTFAGHLLAGRWTHFLDCKKSFGWQLTPASRSLVLGYCSIFKTVDWKFENSFHQRDSNNETFFLQHGDIYKVKYWHIVLEHDFF